ncbi:TetR/AcrR family transcriptional regulator [Streptomyces sp. NPDC018045]|uniref:TetR/AcrR family transcriptional regulator n=1 Tax=Streptomyces sp. NPDC018045 TaxID=3365037 RepID=UPI0037B0B6F9
MSTRTAHRGRHGGGVVRDDAAPGAGPEAAAPAHGPRRGATRRKLFDAAVTLIAEQGFSATTVDEIAERAGVAKGTVYYNFASKNVLYEELLRDGVDLLAASLQDAADRAVRAGGGTRVDALDAMIRAGLDFIAGSPSLTQLYVAELWRTNRVWQPTLESVRGRAIAVVESVLRDAIAVGELSEELDVPLTASALLGMVLVAALDWLSFQPHRSVEDVHASLSRLLQGRVSPMRPD